MTQAKVLMLGWRPESVTALRALGADVTCVLTAEEDHKRGDLLETAHAIPVQNPSDVATVLVGLERCGRSVTEFQVICAPGENPLLCAAVLASGGDWQACSTWRCCAIKTCRNERCVRPASRSLTPA